MGEPLIPGLADDVGRAAHRLHGRRRRRLQLATAGTLTVALVAAFAVTTTIQAPPAEAGLDITVRDGQVTVRLTDIETRPDVVEDALRDAGLDADVVALPVGPSNVGRFVGMSGESGPGHPQPLDVGSRSYTGFVVGEEYDGPIDIQIGRPAEAGEDYDVPSDALAPDEPLACAELAGRPAREVPATIADFPDVEVSVHFFADGVPIDADVDPADLPSSPYADWVVVQADAFSASTAIIAITPDGRTPFGTPALPPSPGCD